MVKNGTPASPAMARASRVLPVPGAPASSTPLGMRPPSLVNFCGSRRKSMISSSSALASSIPATSLKVTLTSPSPCSLALVLPKDSAPPLPPICICRMKKIQTPIRSSIGNQETKMVRYQGFAPVSSRRISTPIPAAWESTRVGGSLVLNGRPSLPIPDISSP
jgi:hypothetical protein